MSVDDGDHTTTPSPTSGRYGAHVVHTGLGGGLADLQRITPTATHYSAARMEDIGDVVLAITRTLDSTRSGLGRLDLRAFLAAAPARGALMADDAETFIARGGALAIASINVADAEADVDERNSAILERCLVSASIVTPSEITALADLLLTAWEAELRFGSWPAIEGTMDAFDRATWAPGWLRGTDHRVDDQTFLKVLVPAWLEPMDAPVSTYDAAHGDDEELDG